MSKLIRSDAMAKLGMTPLAKQRQWQSSLVLLCCLLFLSTFALSLTVYSARQAHVKLLGGLKDRGTQAVFFPLKVMLVTLTLCLTIFYATESKINQLHQKMAEVKVESVEMQSRAEDAENQRIRVQDTLDRVSRELDEVRVCC